MKIKVFLTWLLVLWATVCFGASQTTSSTTAATIIDRVEARLNDSDNRMWSAGDLLTWLNEGMLDIAMRTHCMEATETETLVADTIEYALSSFDNAVSNYITIKAVHYIDSDSKAWALTKGSPQSVGQAGEDTDTATPAYWYEWNGSVGVYPPLSAIDGTTAETIKAYYIELPPAIASSANITIPHIYEPALIYYMLAQAYLRDNQLHRFLQTIALYDAQTRVFRMDFTENPKEVVE